MLARVSPSPRRARLAAAVLLSLLGGCLDYTTGLPGAAFNTPAVGLGPGGFGYNVVARGWTTDETYTLDIAAPTIGVGLAITGYRGGTGTLAVTDADGRVAFSRSLAGNVAHGNSTASGRPPFTVQVTATDYTGIVALGIGEGED